MHLYSSLLSSHLSASVLAFNPGAGSPPPGVAGPFDTLMSWVAWGVFSLAIVGVLVTAGRMIVAHHNGRGGEHGQSLAFVLGGTVLAASASAIVGVLVP